MRRNTFLGGGLALLMAAALFSFAPRLQAGTRYNAQEQGQQQAQPQRAPAQQTVKVTGKIMKLNNGHYALVTGKTPKGGPAGHYLNGGKNLQKYSGQTVVVTGTFNRGTNTIHVTTIHKK